MTILSGRGLAHMRRAAARINLGERGEAVLGAVT
jgi:hypothetical protein